MTETLNSYVKIYRWCNYNIDELKKRAMQIEESKLYPDLDKSERLKAIGILIDEKEAITR